MGDEKYTILGPLMGAIGEEAAAIVGGDPDGLYMFADAGEGYAGAAIYMDEGEVVRYYATTMELHELIMEAWETEEPNVRWKVMEYHIIGTRFDAQFTFADQVDPELTVWDIRDMYLRRRFGDKPIIYSDLPNDTVDGYAMTIR